MPESYIAAISRILRGESVSLAQENHVRRALRLPALGRTGQPLKLVDMSKTELAWRIKHREVIDAK